MTKPLLLFLYGVSVYITLSRWYKAGNSGMPDPAVIGPSTYLFGVLLLTSDFLEGLPVILGLAMTFVLFNQGKPETIPTGSSPQLNLGSKKK